MDGDDWCGLTVRTHEGAVVGIVVGAFVEGPLAGWLRVQGNATPLGRQRGARDGSAVYAIPRAAVVRRRQDSLLLGAV
jgi:hypothetical protein